MIVGIRSLVQDSYYYTLQSKNILTRAFSFPPVVSIFLSRDPKVYGGAHIYEELAHGYIICRLEVL
jgi:hypothetical protein